MESHGEKHGKYISANGPLPTSPVCYIEQIFPEQFTVKAKEPLIPKWLYNMVASMEAAIFSCQCDQMQNCEGGCDTIYNNGWYLPQTLRVCWHQRLRQSRRLAWF